MHYFVSYYDYYQPEAYIPQRDIYIEKDASINEEIDRLRLADDQLAGQPARCDHRGQRVVHLRLGLAGGLQGDDGRPAPSATRSIATRCCAKLVDIQYERNDIDFVARQVPRARRLRRGLAELRGVRLSASSSGATRSSSCRSSTRLSGEVIDQLEAAVHLSGQALRDAGGADRSGGRRDQAGAAKSGSSCSRSQGKLLEAQRLSARTRFDIEMMHGDGLLPGHRELQPAAVAAARRASTPYTLFDFFPEGLSADRRRVARHGAAGAGRCSPATTAARATLVEHGFRLPSALDNRPLKFDEWEEKINQVVYVSATPGPYELEQDRRRSRRASHPADRAARPGDRSLSGPRAGAAFAGADSRAGGGRRARAGDDADQAAGRRSVVLSRRARRAAANGCTASWTRSSAWSCCAICGTGKFEALVGVNLLREGLDLPEVSLVAILDADKEGFLRSETSLMQTIGRAARNVNAKVILYADKVTDSMQRAIDETASPPGVAGRVQQASTASRRRRSRRRSAPASKPRRPPMPRPMPKVGRTDETQYITEEYIAELEAEMFAAAEGWSSNGRRRFAIGLQNSAIRSARKSATSISKPTATVVANAAADMAAGFHGQKSKRAPQRASVVGKVYQTGKVALSSSSIGCLANSR